MPGKWEIINGVKYPVDDHSSPRPSPEGHEGPEEPKSQDEIAFQRRISIIQADMRGSKKGGTIGDNLFPVVTKPIVATHLPAARKSHYKGVSWHKKSGKWMAQIRHERGTEFLGLFAESDEEKAARAYEAAAHRLGLSHRLLPSRVTKATVTTSRRITGVNSAPQMRTLSDYQREKVKRQGKK